MDESFRSVLPYFRLRVEYPWLMDIVVGLFLLLVLSALITSLVRKYRWQRYVWNTFSTTALERGLSDAQWQLLKQIARHDRMKNPLLLLSSLNAFDRHISRYVSRLTNRNKSDRHKTIEDLAHIRTLLGFDRPLLGQPMRTTRELEPGHTLMVWPVKGGGHKGFSQCVVVSRDDRAITAVPLLREDDQHLTALAPGDKIKVRFWRDHDTEYRFRTKILDAVAGTTSIVIEHAEYLERIQKRDFFRLNVGFGVVLYAVSETEQIAEDTPRLEGTVTDISGGGLNILTRKEVPPAGLLRIDPQFKEVFPLAGLQCKVIGQLKQPGGYGVHLEFVELSPKQEGELVRKIYEQQIHRAVHN